MSDYTKKDEIEKKFNAMKNEASIWLDSWKELSLWLSPTRGKFDGDTTNDGSLLNYTIHLINNATSLAIRSFVAGMMAGITSPFRSWFKLEMEEKELNDQKPIKLWLELVENKIRDTFAKSNAYNMFAALYEEIGVFATAAALIEKDNETVIRLRSFTAGEYFLVNDSKGRINTFAREFSMTVAQMVEEFGYNNVSLTVKNNYDLNNLTQTVNVRHLICPNLKRKLGKLDNKNMKYSSYYWEADNNDFDNKFLKESGYNNFPIIAPRWGLTTTSDIYGKDSPGWLCLGDTRQLQEMTKDISIATEKTIYPPHLVEAGVEAIDLDAHGVTRYNPENPNSFGAKPLSQEKIDFNAISFVVQDITNRINKAFYGDLFLLGNSFDDTTKTATEINFRAEEKLLALSRILEQFNNEAISPLIDLTFQYLLEFGLIPTQPPEIEGKDYKIEYISTVAQAQKMVGTQAIEQYASMIGNLSAVFPEVVDKFNSDEAADIYGTKLGVSQKIIRSKKEVEYIRNQRAKQQQAIKQEEQVANMVQGAKVLSETEVRDDNALGQLVGA